MSERHHRRQLIRHLLSERDVASQEELQQILLEHGVDTTQATLSRDLRDLGVMRQTDPGGRRRYALIDEDRYREALRRVVGMEILNVRHNTQLVVVHTLKARAEGVAGFLDSWGNADLMGTVAGDDTIIVVPSEPSRCEDLARAIRALVTPPET